MDSYVLTLYDDAGNPIPIPAIQGVGIKEIRLEEEHVTHDIYAIVLEDDRIYSFVVRHGENNVSIRNFAPDDSWEGYVGDLWFELPSGRMYICTRGMSRDPYIPAESPYEWKQIEAVRTIRGAPTTETFGNNGDVWVDTLDKVIYVCLGGGLTADGDYYEWIRLTPEKLPNPYALEISGGTLSEPVYYDGTAPGEIKIPQIDDTLTKPGYAADAKAVGDALAKKLGADKLGDAVKDALRQAKESGEFDGPPGITPHVGGNGNWWIGDVDTGVSAGGSVKTVNGNPPDKNGNVQIDLPGGGGGILQETDPTVPAWAKQQNKPTYTKSEVGLGNVDNVKQYSTSNPPPYPVVSVNGKTGAVQLGADDVNAPTKEQFNTLSADVERLSNTDWIPSKEWEEGATLFEDVLAFTSTTAYLSSGNTFSIQPQIPYRVIWNGVIYDCVGKTYDDQPYLGNGRLVHGNYVEDTGEPFGFIAGIFSNNAAYVVKSVSAYEDITVKITTGVYTYNEMPAEYLPATAIQAVDGKMPDEYLPASVVLSINGVTPDENGNVAIAAASPDGGTSEGALPPFRVNVSVSSGSFTQTGTKYTAAELYAIAATRDIIVETKEYKNTKYLYGYYRYVTGSETSMKFNGSYETATSNWIPATVTIDKSGNVSVSRKYWAEGTVKTDTTLAISGSAADSFTVGKKIGELSDHINGMGSGVDVTAQVGQTIVVKAVNANGKPTAWEAADHQPRTHWTEAGADIVFPETTVEIDPEEGIGYTSADFEVEVNKKYTITYNGVEYPDCEWVFIDGLGYVTGNLSALEEYLPVTDHPFVLARAAFEDDDENSIEMFAVMPIDGSGTVTLSMATDRDVTIPTKYIPTLEEMRSNASVILAETIVALDTEEKSAILPISYLEPGEIYVITCNGVSMTRRCARLLYTLAVGNSDDPFMLLSGSTDDGEMITKFVVLDTALRQESEVTLSISIKRIKKISEDYLPAESTSTVVFEVKPSNSGSGEVEFLYDSVDAVIAAVDAGKHVVLRYYSTPFNIIKHLTFVDMFNGYYRFESVLHNLEANSVDVEQVVIDSSGETTWKSRGYYLNAN